MSLNSSSRVSEIEAYNLISIDIDELKEESTGLSEFLEKKLNVKIKIDNKIMNVDSGDTTLSRSKLKDYVERFLYRKDLSDKYKLINEKGTFKIAKKK